VPIGLGIALGLANTESDVASAAQHVIASALSAMLGAVPSVGAPPDVSGLSGISAGPAEVGGGLASIAASQMAQIASVPIASAPDLSAVTSPSSFSMGDINLYGVAGDPATIATMVGAEVDRVVRGAQLALTAAGRRP